jgi:spermidine synthase
VTATSPARLRTALFIVFALSGVSGLVYESIWTHYLKLFLGHAAYAQTLVLAIFMGGMAVGAGIAGRRSHRWRNLLRGYAITEGLVGLLALAFHPVFTGATDWAFGSVLPALGSPAAVTAFKWALGALLILPQSILLGMTFPLMSAGLIRRVPGGSGATLSTLYFANSLGGAAGVLASGFLLVDAIGLPGTVAAAGALNLVLAGAVAWLAGDGGEAPIPAAPAAGAGPGEGDRPWLRLLLAIALLTGASSFAYEIGWIRMLSLVLGASTHAFELMLSAFILGLAAGSLWVRRRIDAAGSPLRFLAWMQLAMGAFALATLPAYGQTFGAMASMMRALGQGAGDYALFNLGSHGIALAIMLPATFCAGTTLPLITHALLRAGHGERAIGAVYSANTIGAIAGVFVSVHLVMPAVGLKGLVVGGAAVDLALGLWLLWREEGWAARRAPAAATALAVAAVAATVLLVRLDTLQMASSVFRLRKLLDPGAIRVLDHRDGKTATVALLEERNGARSIVTNGKVDAAVEMRAATSNGDEATMVMLGAVPQLLKPDARRAAIIGFGSGLSTHVYLASHALERLDTVEIEPAMVEVAKGFRPRNARAYDDPRSHVVFEDAKTYFSSQNRRWDVIVSEPSNPWVSGVAGLFSTEYYRHVARHLAADGLLVQWLHLYEFSDDLAASVLEALGASFPHLELFFANEQDLLIVASGAPIPPIDPAAFTNPVLAAELARVGIVDPQDVEIRRAGNARSLAAWLSTHRAPANSDYRPVVDQGAVRARFMGANAFELVKLASEPIPLMELLGVARPAWDRTRVLPTSNYRRSWAAFRAGTFRDLLAVVDPRTPSGAWPRAGGQTEETARALLATCAAPPGGDKVYALAEIGMQVVPFLRPAELEEVWRRLSAWPCASHLAPEEAAWRALLEAVGRRDAPAMAEHAMKLLASGGASTPGRATYLGSAALLGRIASGDRVGARRLWEAIRADPPDGKEPGLLLRYLGALAEARGDGPATAAGR